VNRVTLVVQDPPPPTCLYKKLINRFKNYCWCLVLNLAIIMIHASLQIVWLYTAVPYSKVTFKSLALSLTQNRSSCILFPYPRSNCRHRGKFLLCAQLTKIFIFTSKYSCGGPLNFIIHPVTNHSVLKFCRIKSEKRLIKGSDFLFFSLSSSLLPHLGACSRFLEHRAESPQFLDQGQSVGLLGRVISSSQGLYVYTNTEKRTHIHKH
jgi:hypothetical protein